MDTNKVAERIAQVTGKTMDETLRLAGEINKLMERMKNERVVTFMFTKDSGDNGPEPRVARGTLLDEIIAGTVKGEGRPSPEHLVKYYDLERQGWRCFKVWNFIKIVEEAA